MVEQNYTLKITLDGADVKSEAQALKQAIEAQLETITIAGKIDLAGLDGLVKQMTEVRKQAGGLGRAMAEGMAGQWGKLETTLTSIQSQITGIVRAGSAMELSGVEDLGTALDKADKKAIGASQEIKTLEARIAGLNTRLGELGATPFQPLSGAATSTVSELFKGFSEGGSKGQISRPHARGGEPVFRYKKIVGVYGRPHARGGEPGVFMAERLQVTSSPRPWG